MKGKWSPAHLAPEGVVVRTKIDLMMLVGIASALSLRERKDDQP